MTNVGQAVSFFAQDRKHPYTQRWSAGLQRELPMKLMVEVSYVGNRNTRININRELSYTPAKYLSTSPVRDQATIDYLGKTYPNPYLGLNPIYGTTMTRANLLRPYNQFSSVQLQADPAGYSWYHSMQSRLHLQRRASSVQAARDDVARVRRAGITAPQGKDEIAPQLVCHAPIRLCEYAQALVQEITHGRDAYLWTLRGNSL